MLRVARPREEAGRCRNITCHVIRVVNVVIRDFVIIDQFLDAERLTMLLNAGVSQGTALRNSTLNFIEKKFKKL